MKKLVPVLLVLCLLVVMAAVAGASSKANGKSTMTGWLVDEKCGVRAAHEGNEACTKKCLEAGSKLAFVNDANKDVVLVHNPDAVKGHEGHHVQVTGSMMDGQLHVDSVATAAAPQEGAAHKH
jgi:hypothetical protein